MSSQSDPGDPEAQRDGSPSADDNVMAPRPWWKLWQHTPETAQLSFNLSSLKRNKVSESPSDNVRLQAIELLFGLGQPHAKNWPGIFVVFSHLEKEFEALLRDDLNVVWKILDREKPSDVRECWHWCLAVLQGFQSLPTKESVSIDNIYKHLTNNLVPQCTASERNSVFLAIFAVLCWTSMTLAPTLEPQYTEVTETNARLCFRTKGLKEGEIPETSLESTSKRPITKLFGILESLIKDHRNFGMNETTETDTIYESSVNIFSLQTIGRVQIEWVEDLNSHLAFDRQLRILFVCRLSSFCVSSILGPQGINILQEVSSGLFPPTRCLNTSVQDKLSSLHREILLTYRILFGQSSQSRSLALKLLEKHKEDHGDIDPFLLTICTIPITRPRFFRRTATPKLPADLFPATIRDINNRIIESDTYSSKNDFPHFGSRLLAVQQYNLRQQPSRVRDLWRDRRNPLQWYTFWAVLWVGGITIVLAILQLAAGIVQTYYSVLG